MRYFVTGATGFIGGHLVGQLLGDGHEVVALVRDPERARDLEARGVVLAPGDITRPETLRAPMEGADGVFHLAAWYKVGVRNPEAARVNVDGTRNVLEAMRDVGVPKGVYTSTLAVFSDTGGRLVDEGYRYDGPHLSVYDATKWRAHYEVALPMAAAGLPLVIVQPGAVYGPGDPSPLGDLFRQYLSGRLPVLPGETAYCWAHVEDVARAHILAMEEGAPGRTYIVAGEPHTLVDAFRIAERITGVAAPRLVVPPALLRALAAVLEPVGRFLPLPPTYSAETLRVAAGTTYLGDNGRARRELDYAPRPLARGLRETFEG